MHRPDYSLYRLTWRSSNYLTWERQPPNHGNAGYTSCMGLWLNTKYLAHSAADTVLDWAHLYRLRPHLWTAALMYPGDSLEPVTGDSLETTLLGLRPGLISTTRTGDYWLFWFIIVPFAESKVTQWHTAYMQVQNHILGTGNSISNWQQFTQFCEELILHLAVLLFATWGALQQSAES